MDDMNDLRDDRVGYVHVNLLRASLSCLLAWRLFFLLPLAGASIITLCLWPCSSTIHCWFCTGLCRGPTLLLHRMRQGVHMALWLFSSHVLILFTLLVTAHPQYPLRTSLPLSSRQQPEIYEPDQACILANLAKMHNFSPRPELRPFPDSHPFLYCLFPPPPTAALITQAVVHPTLAVVTPISFSTTHEITGTRGRRTAASD